MALSFSKGLLLFPNYLSFCLKIDDIISKTPNDTRCAVTMATFLLPSLFHAGFTFQDFVLIKHRLPVMRWLQGRYHVIAHVHAMMNVIQAHCLETNQKRRYNSCRKFTRENFARAVVCWNSLVR